MQGIDQTRILLLSSSLFFLLLRVTLAYLLPLLATVQLLLEKALSWVPKQSAAAGFIFQLPSHLLDGEHVNITSFGPVHLVMSPGGITPGDINCHLALNI